MMTDWFNFLFLYFALAGTYVSFLAFIKACREVRSRWYYRDGEVHYR